MAILGHFFRGEARRIGRARYGALGRLFNVAALIGLLALAAPARANEVGPRLMLMGDSLTAGYGLPIEEGFVAQLGAALKAAGLDVTLLNAGVSGDTTAGGRARLDWALADRPTHAMLALGANDALRGLPPEAAEANLRAMLETFRAEGVPTLIVGMRAPRNWGDDYVEAFDAIYPTLAQDFDAPLYPFFLEGVALDPALNQPDGIHPNAEGVARIVEQMTPAIVGLLKREPTS